MSDKSSLSNVSEVVSSAVGSVGEAVGSEVKKMGQTVISQVVNPTPPTPEQEQEKEIQKAKDDAEVTKINRELHEIAEKLDQPSQEELEKRRVEQQRKQAEEEKVELQKQQNQKNEQIVLPGSGNASSSDPLAVTAAKTKKERKLGVGG